MHLYWISRIIYCCTINCFISSFVVIYSMIQLAKLSTRTTFFSYFSLSFTQQNTRNDKHNTEHKFSLFFFLFSFFIRIRWNVKFGFHSFDKTVIYFFFTSSRQIVCHFTWMTYFIECLFATFFRQLSRTITWKYDLFRRFCIPPSRKRLKI